MSWRDRLTTASFRDFKFLTDSHEATGGRRLVVHEFPGADVVSVEDLGAKASGWKLNAYFLGADYDKERNGFLAKLAKPGADWLTHPWLGLLWVRAHTWSVHESNDKGGYCTVSIDFVPGGESVQPTADAVDKAYSRIHELSHAAAEDYVAKGRPLSATAMTAFLALVHAKLESLRTLISLAALPLTFVNQIKGLIAGIQGDLGTLLATPSAYAAAFAGLADALGGGADQHGVADTDRTRLVALFTRMVVSGSVTTLSGAAATDSALRVTVQREQLMRSTFFVMAAAQTALADYRAADDRDVALASVLAAIDRLLPLLSDDVFQVAVSARAALMDALLAQDLAPATYRDVVAPLPAVVLAYRMGVDVDVFLAQNKVRHPLFVMGRVRG